MLGLIVVITDWVAHWLDCWAGLRCYY